MKKGPACAAGPDALGLAAPRRRGAYSAADSL